MKKLNKLYLIVAFMFVGYSCEITDLDQLNNPNAVTLENAGIDLYWNSVQTSVFQVGGMVIKHQCYN